MKFSLHWIKKWRKFSRNYVKCLKNKCWKEVLIIANQDTSFCNFSSICSYIILIRENWSMKNWKFQSELTSLSFAFSEVSLEKNLSILSQLSEKKIPDGKVHNVRRDFLPYHVFLWQVDYKQTTFFQFMLIVFNRCSIISIMYIYCASIIV